MESVNAVTVEAEELEPAASSVRTTKQKTASQPQATKAGESIPVFRQANTAIGAQTQNQEPAASNPWAPLLSAGLKFVEALAAAPPGSGSGNGKQPAVTVSPLIETDAKTGRSYLKLPMPEPQVVQQLSDALSRLLAGLGQ